MKNATAQKNDKHAVQLIAITIGFLVSFIVMAAISNPRLLM